MPRDPHIDKLIQDIKAKKFREGEAKDLTKTYGEEISKQLKPLFEAHSKEMTGKTSEALIKAIQNLKIDVPEQKVQEMPDIPAPVVHVPAPVVNVPAPIVNVPAPIVNIPENKYPDPLPFPDSFKLAGVDKMHPMPVVMVDEKGRPAQFPIAGGGGGGRADFFTIKDIQNSSGGSIIDNDGFVKVTGSFSVSASNSSTQAIDSSGNPYSQANPFPVVFSSSGTTASALIDSSGVQYSGSNPLPVTFAASATQAITVANVESALNSSVATLGIGGEFTGGVEDVLNYASISYYVFSDVGSSTNGFVIRQSKDGTNFDSTDSYTIPAGTGKIFSVQPAARYIQAFYANGASAQTSFRLGQYNHYIAAQPSSQRPSDAYTNETDMQQFWGFMSGFNGSTWDRISNQSGVSTNAIRVQAATDAVESVNIVSPIGQGDSTSAIRTIQAGDSVSSVIVNSGTITTVTTLTGVTNSVAVVALDRDGNPLTTGPIAQGDSTTALRVVHAGDVGVSVTATQTGTWNINAVTSVTNSIAASLVDSSNVQYSGSNPVPITIVSGALTSTLSVGDSAARTADNGGNPVKVGGIARTTNPSAFANGDRSNFSSDKLGRQLMRPIQVRDLIKTAYVSLTTGTEATLLAGTAGAFNDLIMITATNNSTAATQLDIRAVTGGNIIHTMYLPAQSGPVGFAPSVPWPQDATGNNWTVDMPDQTGTTVYVSALFSQEI